MSVADTGRTRALRAVCAAMGAGVGLLAVAAIAAGPRPPRLATPQALRLVNALTAWTMAAAFVGVLASEWAWKSILRRAPGRAGAAFLARTALREAGAVLGCATAYVASRSGVLSAYPAYWANLAPAILFWAYVWLHWPAPGSLRAEVEGRGSTQL